MPFEFFLRPRHAPREKRHLLFRDERKVSHVRTYSRAG
jgi:hypothetical protein